MKPVAFVVFAWSVSAAGCVAEIGGEIDGEPGTAAASGPVLECVAEPADGGYAHNALLEAAWNSVAGVIELYDRDSCELWDTVAPPEGDDDVGFATAIALTDPADPPHPWDEQGHMWVGVPGREYERCTNAFCALFCPRLCASKFYGLVYGMPLDQLDASWGPVGTVLDNPVKKLHTDFGAAIAADDQLLAIGSPGNGRVYLFTSQTAEPVALDGHGVAGPFSYEAGSQEIFALTGPGARFGGHVELESLPAEPIGGGMQRLTRRVRVWSDSASRCFELTGEARIWDPPSDCPDDVYAPTDAPPPEECMPPLPAFSWDVDPCAD